MKDRKVCVINPVFETENHTGNVYMDLDHSSLTSTKNVNESPREDDHTYQEVKVTHRPGRKACLVRVIIFSVIFGAVLGAGIAVYFVFLSNRTGNQSDTNQYGPWSTWTSCSDSCEDGNQTRTRICQTNQCPGVDIETRVCDNGPCRNQSDTNQYGPWSTWTSCSASCVDGNQTRTRFCQTNQCPGVDIETRVCNNGTCLTWSSWGNWDSCDVTCGFGQQERTRECYDPDSTGEDCPGLKTESRICNSLCVWTSWMGWSECDVTCDGGVRHRIRICRDSNKNTISDEFCAGQPQDDEACSTWSCPDCSRQCDLGVLNSDCDACVCDSSLLKCFVHGENNMPLSDVTIAYEERPYIPLVVTDTSGTFTISGVCATSTAIIATKNQFGTVVEQSVVIDSTTSSIDITMERMELPLIVDNPRSKMRTMGDSVALCCMATGSPPVTKYEWLKNGDILEMPDANTEKLTLSGLDTGDSGTYKCRVTNMAGSVYSDEASLTVEASTSGSCSSEPISRILPLPLGCVHPETGGATYDVGTCPNTPCGGVQEDQTQCRDPDEYCCGVTSTETVQISCTDYEISLATVSLCGCTICQALPIRIYGRAVSVSDDTPFRFGGVFYNNEQVAMTDLEGAFVVEIVEQVTRVSLTFKDIFQANNLVETTQVVNVVSGSNIFLLVKMKVKPSPLEILSSIENSIPILGDEFVSVGEVVIPPNSLFDSNGDLYEGQALVYLTNIDMRRELDLEAAPGDFSAVDIEGNLVSLESYGILMLDVTTPDGDELSIAGPIPLHIDPTVVPAVDQDVGPDGISSVKLWILNPKTGSWEETSHLQSTNGKRRRKQTTMYVGSIQYQKNQLYNIDGIWHQGDICFAKVIPYASNAYDPSEVLDNAQFTALIRDTTGTQVPFGRYGRGWTYPSTSYNGAGFCISVGCNTAGTLQTFISGSLYGDYLVPENNPNISTGILNALNFQISNGTNDAINLTIPNSVVSSASPPVFNSDPYPSRRNYMCDRASTDITHFPFYLSPAAQLNMVQKHDVVARSFMKMPLSFYPLANPHPCFLRIHVTSSYDILRVITKSFAGDPTLSGNPAGSNALYGTREVNIVPDENGEADVCIEYKCPGNVFNSSNGFTKLGTDFTTRIQLEIWNYIANGITPVQYNCNACFTEGFWNEYMDLHQASTIPVCQQGASNAQPFEFLIDDITDNTGGTYGDDIKVDDMQKLSYHDPQNCVKNSADVVALNITC